MARRARRLVFGTLIAALSLSAPACRTTDTTVVATLEDFRIVLEPGSVPEGMVRFEVANAGTAASQSVHELVLLRTDLTPEQLPTLPAGAVDEGAEGVAVAGYVENIAPGAGAVLRVEVDPGNYLAICNIRGHFAQGMVARFTVT